MLEDLFIDIISDNPGMACIETLFQCIQANGLTLPTNMSKARINAWLATQPDCEKRLGEAALSGFFPITHPALQTIIRFIQDLTR